MKNGLNLVKSPMNYVGGKYRLLSQILPLFPTKIDTFVDLFCGGLDVINDDVIATLNAKFTEANFLTNQEFLRFRTGSMYTYSGNKGDIYFRVSSIDFDWFPLIEKFVIDSKQYIETVTISYDEQSGKIGRGGNKFYILDGKKMLGIPVDEFISLGGRPVVEGKELFEVFGNFGEFHNVNIFDVRRKRYVMENFS